MCLSGADAEKEMLWDINGSYLALWTSGANDLELLSVDAPTVDPSSPGSLSYSFDKRRETPPQDSATDEFCKLESALIPPISLGSLGDPSFAQDLGVHYGIMAGAMASGIASVELVQAMKDAGMFAVFGAAGLPLNKVEEAINQLSLGGTDPGGTNPLDSIGFNLIHSPGQEAAENAVVDLYLARGVRNIEAAAFMKITPALVRFRVAGIFRDAGGKVVAPNRVIAKVSRIELAEKFWSPPPAEMISSLVDQGHITPEQATMAAEIPLAQDITAESDSGGHTDNRPALTMLPAFLALRDRMAKRYSLDWRLRVGLAGGIATPASAAAAFAMGAAYVVTGSVNQACIESGTSDLVRQMLAKTKQADVTMTACADMFEMGVKVQVLKNGTMFPMRAAKLYDLYRAHASLEEIPAADRDLLEKSIFKKSLGEVWQETCAFFADRDPGQLLRAEQDPKHKMALIFRSYLGQSSTWAKHGTSDRQFDYQIWCGPAMGAFNQWAAGSFLEKPTERRVAEVNLNILFGAAVMARGHTARMQGVPLRSATTFHRPMTKEEILNKLGEGAAVV